MLVLVWFLFQEEREGGRESGIVCVQWAIVRCTVVGDLKRACECDGRASVTCKLVCKLFQGSRSRFANCFDCVNG